MGCRLTANFSYCLFWWWDERRSFTARFTTSRMFLSFSNRSHYSQHYLAISELFCKVVSSPAEAMPGAISQLHQLEFTIRWQSTNAFLRCGLLVAGEGCVSGPLVSELASLCCSGIDYRGLPEDFPKVSYHLDHITMTFSGTNLILSANPGYQAFHRSFRSNTLWVWLQYLSLLSQKNQHHFFSVKYWKHPLKLSLFLPREAETFICQWCLNVSAVQWIFQFFSDKMNRCLHDNSLPK